MKKALLFLLLGSSITAQARQISHQIPHLDPEMTGHEYRQLFATMKKNHQMLGVKADNPLLAILELGKRSLDWIDLINQSRDEQHKLQLTTPETTGAYPIENPGYSNPTLIQDNLKSMKKEMPAALAEVLFGTAALPELNPLDDETFIYYARMTNRIYESASRWLLEEPYLAEYTRMAQQDIRGYYFLNKETDLRNKLVQWDSLADSTKKQYSTWLIGECINTKGDFESCNTILQAAIEANAVLMFHEQFQQQSQIMYNNFFEIQNPRPEAVWNSTNSKLMHMPFALPENDAVQNWFKSNVEDEFHWGDWALHIDYQQGDNLAKIVFEAGTTPHVNDAGDTITMDANRALNEYASRWTIRHEFGHVLGFPDCYVEFYDKSNQVMVNYQLDITNLMCSRRGHLQAGHFEQMEKNYYKGE